MIDTYGKMQLMDRLILHDRVAKVIDLGFHAFDEFFKMCEEIGFIKEALRRRVAPIILFVAGTDRVSSRSHEMLRWRIPPGRWSPSTMNSCCAASYLKPWMARA